MQLQKRLIYGFFVIASIANTTAKIISSFYNSEISRKLQWVQWVYYTSKLQWENSGWTGTHNL